MNTPSNINILEEIEQLAREYVRDKRNEKCREELLRQTGKLFCLEKSYDNREHIWFLGQDLGACEVSEDTWNSWIEEYLNASMSDGIKYYEYLLDKTMEWRNKMVARPHEFSESEIKNELEICMARYVKEKELCPGIWTDNAEMAYALVHMLIKHDYNGDEYFEYRNNTFSVGLYELKGWTKKSEEEGELRYYGINTDKLRECIMRYQDCGKGFFPYLFTEINKHQFKSYAKLKFLYEKKKEENEAVALTEHINVPGEEKTKVTVGLAVKKIDKKETPKISVMSLDPKDSEDGKLNLIDVLPDKESVSYRMDIGEVFRIQIRVAEWLGDFSKAIEGMIYRGESGKIKKRTEFCVLWTADYVKDFCREVADLNLGKYIKYFRKDFDIILAHPYETNDRQDCSICQTYICYLNAENLSITSEEDAINEIRSNKPEYVDAYELYDRYRKEKLLVDRCEVNKLIEYFNNTNMYNVNNEYQTLREKFRKKKIVAEFGET